MRHHVPSFRPKWNIVGFLEFQLLFYCNGIPLFWPHLHIAQTFRNVSELERNWNRKLDASVVTYRCCCMFLFFWLSIAIDLCSLRYGDRWSCLCLLNWLIETQAFGKHGSCKLMYVCVSVRVCWWSSDNAVSVVFWFSWPSVLFNVTEDFVWDWKRR